ncbi:xanthine dehydrogenase family protein molybdopterin-binding subunit [Halovulum dunhuangense]|uniref:xanthine dehydrogenase family protein molybdopterin-binding subunit n=1 Tax=Halovulum dunhuangense TaxID=1505036 RepID=UPI0031B5E950
MKIGQSVKRVEDMALVRGLGRYTADLPAAEGELAMALVRSPAAAGRLKDLDIADALAADGVVAVLTAAELAADGIGPITSRMAHPGPDGGPMRAPCSPLLAGDAVHFVGQPVAIVLATSRAAAEDAADLVVPVIEERAAVTDAAAALGPDAPRVWPEFPDNRCFQVEKGDLDAVRAAMARAHRVVARRLRVSRVTAAALEPRAARGRFDPETGRFHLELGTQAPHRVAMDLAPVLGVAPDRVHVTGQACGGSFGMKNMGTAEAALALWAARRTGRPVRWVASRLESFMGDPQGRDQWIDVRLALDADGIFLGLEVAMIANLGACLGPSTVHPPVANLGGLAGVYRTPAIHATVTGVFTNTQHTAPYRGAGRPEATYAIESAIDAAAAETGLDRAELRRRNMIRPEEMPFRTGLVFTYDSGDFPAVLARAQDAADWDGFPARQAAARARGRLRGIGIACPIEIAGGPAPKPHGEYAALELAPEGRVRLRAGSFDSGQGHATSFRQVLADRLGLDPEGVELVTGDTDVVPQGTGTFGSRTLAAAGTAVWSAMDEIIERLRGDAADMLEAAATDIDFADGHYVVAGTDRRLPFGAVLARQPAPLSAEGFVAAESATFPNGCHVCELEIDPETGRTFLERYVVVDDVGTVVNPLIVKGQIAGGVAQGVGQALCEHLQHDADTGQLLTASFMDYAMPRAGDLPGIEVLSHPVPTRANPLGVKGAGEAGTVGALAAVMSAVRDALAPAGVGHIDMPATPGRIWAALRDSATAG